MSKSKRDLVKELSINPEVVTGLITQFIRQQFHQTGLQKGILGLSGGVDSSVVAALAVRALGCQNVIAFLLSSDTTAAEDLNDAEELANMLNIQVQKFEITPLLKLLEEKLVGHPDRLRRGNLMARLRMTILYDQAKYHSALVLGTSNKTEILLGYFTLWGDAAADLKPIGDLYKTQVLQLAEYLNIPRRIINKPPTAGLWVGQTDEEELGYRYREIDQLLYFLIEGQGSLIQAQKLGFDEKLISDVIQRIRHYAFKRQPVPVAKLNRTSIWQSFQILDCVDFNR